VYSPPAVTAAAALHQGFSAARFSSSRGKLP
jgi:hypothetical protein